MAPLFVYGSLVDPAVLARVCGGRVGAFPSEPAVLDGHRRVFVAGAWYPTLVPRAGGRVEGLLLDGLGRDSLRRLGDYEGPEYEIRAVTVTGERRGPVTARCFLTRPGVRVSDRDWTQDDWAAARRRILRRGGRAADIS